jgi:hypothetical protein
VASRLRTGARPSARTADARAPWNPALATMGLVRGVERIPSLWATSAGLIRTAARAARCTGIANRRKGVNVSPVVIVPSKSNRARSMALLFCPANGLPLSRERRPSAFRFGYPPLRRSSVAAAG